MKIRFFLIFFLAWASISAQITVEVQQNTTTHLVFPSDIIYLDLGDNQQYLVDYTNNILRLKAAQQAQATNLTVITEDRFYYSFPVQRVLEPKLNYFIETTDAVQNIGFVKNQVPSSTIKVQKQAISEQRISHPSRSSKIPNPSTQQKNYQKQQKEQAAQVLKNTAHQIVQKKAIYHTLTARHDDIKLKVSGIYHSLDYCYIQYEIENKGAIPYDIAYTEFGIKEKKRPKRTALNEERLSPIFILNEEIKRILPMRKNHFVAVFPKLAVPKDRLLYLEVIEDGRNLKVSIPFGRLKIEQI